MKTTGKTKGKRGSTGNKACPSQVPDEPQAETTFTRWSSFEKAVLSKVANPEACKKLIAERQAEVDDDSNETDLVVDFFRQKLRDENQNPDTCCLFFTTAEITDWLQKATGNNLPINKATPYLRALSIAELSYSKKTGRPGWVWRGSHAKPKKTATMFNKLRLIPGS